MIIDIDNRQDDVPVDVQELASLYRACLERLNLDRIELSVLLVDEAEIARLNRERMGSEGPTDVLSFPQHELHPDRLASELDAQMRRLPRGAELVLGDIVLCPAVILAQAPASPWDPAPPIALHGEPADESSPEQAEASALVGRCPEPPGPESQFHLVSVHGLLHLLGHDHATLEQARAMAAEQERLLQTAFEFTVLAEPGDGEEADQDEDEVTDAGTQGRGDEDEEADAETPRRGNAERTRGREGDAGAQGRRDADSEDGEETDDEIEDGEGDELEEDEFDEEETEDGEDGELDEDELDEDEFDEDEEDDELDEEAGEGLDRSGRGRLAGPAEDDLYSSGVPEGFRAGYVALIGRPNVGKSTLMNALVGEKISITSRKPQTTRNRILGIVSEPRAQVLFIDTPGLHQARDPFNRRLVEAALESLQDADLILYMIEPSARVGPEEEFVLETLSSAQVPVFLLINKVDSVAKEKLLPVIALFSQRGNWTEVFPISALDGTNLPQLMQAITAHLPEGPALYPSDQLTDQTERFIAAERVREKVLELARQEVPYSTAVVIDRWEEKPNVLRIAATVHVERQSQKAILIGRGGSMLKRIGTAARHDLESFFGCRIYLELFVRVSENWRQSEGFLRSQNL